MSKKAVIRQNLFSGIFFITKKLAYEKKNKENKHHFLSENCSTFFTRKFRAIKKILILVISIEAHLPTVRRRLMAMAALSFCPRGNRLKRQTTC